MNTFNMNNSLGMPGIYRGVLLGSDGALHVWVPQIHNEDKIPTDADASDYPRVQWCAYNVESCKLEAYANDRIAWVMFENGDSKLPVVLSYKKIIPPAGSGGSFSGSSINTGSFNGGLMNGGSLTGMSGNILIIPGHDNNTNTSGGTTGVDEATLTRELAVELHNELEKLQTGISTIYTLDTDHCFYVDQDSGKLDNYDFSKYATAIEIHFNSGPAAFCLVRNERINDDLSIDTEIANAVQSVGFRRDGAAVRPVSGNTNYDTLGDIEFLYSKGINMIYLETANMDSSSEMSLFKSKKTELAAKMAKILYDRFGGRTNISGVIDPSQWIYPLAFRAYPGSAGHFGDGRSNGRTHAGIDLFTVGNGVNHVNAPVYACQSGKVKELTNDFLEAGVGQISVKNIDGSWIRYGEVNALNGINIGDDVTKGQQIGYVPTNSAGNAMIHFEVFVGTYEGPLSDTSNTKYDFVPAKTYRRRSDLYDPSFIQNIPIGK